VLTRWSPNYTLEEGAELKTLHDFDGKIIGYIDDVNNELVILRGSWKAILIKEDKGHYRNVTRPPEDIKEKVIRATIDTLLEMGMLDAAIVSGPDPSPPLEEDIEMIQEGVDKKLRDKCPEDCDGWGCSYCPTFEERQKKK